MNLYSSDCHRCLHDLHICQGCGEPQPHGGDICPVCRGGLTADNETSPAGAQTAGKDPSNKAEEGKQ